MERQLDQEQDGIGELRLPGPPGNVRHLAQVQQRHPWVQRAQINHQHGGAEHPRQMAHGKVSPRILLIFVWHRSFKLNFSTSRCPVQLCRRKSATHSTCWVWGNISKGCTCAKLKTQSPHKMFKSRATVAGWHEHKIPCAALVWRSI